MKTEWREKGKFEFIRESCDQLAFYVNCLCILTVGVCISTQPSEDSGLWRKDWNKNRGISSARTRFSFNLLIQLVALNGREQPSTRL